MIPYFRQYHHIITPPPPPPQKPTTISKINLLNNLEKTTTNGKQLPSNLLNFRGKASESKTFILFMPSGMSWRDCNTTRVYTTKY